MLLARLLGVRLSFAVFDVPYRLNTGKNETQKLKFDTISHSQNQNQQGFSKSPAEVELQPLARLRGRPPAPWSMAKGELAAHAAGGQGRLRTPVNNFE